MPCFSKAVRSGSRRCPTAARQQDSVVGAAAAVGAADVERFTHGTTIATNALLQRRGARTALVTNEGFEHVLHLRRQTRAHLYRPCVHHSPPLVPLERCVGVRGRTGPDGELVPLDLDTLPEIDAEAIAVSLLFSFRDPEPERRVAEELRRRYPSAHVVASHEVAPEFREYERASTTAVDAYLGPVLSRYLGALEGACADAGLPAPLVMRSSGGLATLEEAAAHAAFALALRARCRCRRRGAGSRRSQASRTRSRSTWAARRRTCARSSTVRRGASTSVSSTACRSVCRPSPCTRWGQAAARSSGSTRAERCASARRARAPIPGLPATGGAVPGRP